MSPIGDRRRASGCSCAHEHPEQRRLAGAVGADDADDARPRQREREVLDRAAGRRSPCAGSSTSITGRRGADRAGWRSRARAATAFVVLRLGQQLLVGDEAGLALGLAGPRRHAHPLELAGQGPLLRVGLLLLHRQPGELLLEPAGVVALERDAAAAVELEDPLGDVVEEVAVVGDRDDRARCTPAGTARASRPTRRRGGWSARRAAAGPGGWSSSRHSATRRFSPPDRRRHVGVVGRAAERVHRDVHVALEVPRVGRGDPVLQGRLLGADGLVVGVGVGPLGHHGVVLRR